MSVSDHISCPKCLHRFQSGGTEERADCATKDDQNIDSDPMHGRDSPFRIQAAAQRPVGADRLSRCGGTAWRRLRGSPVLLLLLISIVLSGVGLVCWWGAPELPRSASPSVRVLPVAVPPTASAMTSDPHREMTSYRSSDASLQRLIRLLDQAVVRIESDHPGGKPSLGAGFLIHPDGLIATNYHVISNATRAWACFREGDRCRVTGYAAIAPELDLAILQLESIPLGVQPLRLRYTGDPPQLLPVVAAGHPLGVAFSTYNGTVSRVVSTSHLPRRSRDFLHETIAGNQEHRWIQHTARLAEGYSGGPLLNAEGEVIGVNTWFDHESGLGHALHAAHLHQLTLQRLPQVEPLERFACAEAQTNLRMERISAARVDQLLEDAQAMRWLPASDADYSKLQELAWAVTFAHQPTTLAGSDQPGGFAKETLEPLLDAADRVVVQLRAERWNRPGQLLLVNERAAGAVHRAGAGVFFFGTVERVVEGDGGTRAILMQLAGMDQTLLVPRDGQLDDPPPGTSCLVLGVNLDGQVVRFGENPLQPTIAPVIVSRTLLRLEP